MASGAVSWLSKLQSIIALSTTEAEFIAAVTAGKETLWFRQFLSELGFKFSAPLMMLVDNQSAIQVACNPKHHGCKLTYKIGHMFSTFGKMSLLLGYLHSHNYNESTGF
jgi:hypothetical protein